MSSAASGAWAVVTGASSGIGTEFARALRGRGLRVVLVAVSAFRDGIVVTTILRIPLGEVVMMEVGKPLQEEHRQETAQRPRHRAIERPQLLRRIGDEMQHRDAEHQAGDEADGQLQPGVREADHEREPASGQRRGQNESAVNGEHPARRHHGPVIMNPSFEHQ